jgi:hypothetical protein
MAPPNIHEFSVLKERSSSSIYNLDVFSLLRDFHPTSPSSCSGSKSQEVRIIVSEAEAEARYIDAELAKLRSQIIALENKKRLMQYRIHACKSFLSPIRRLPNDVLLEIFRHISRIEFTQSKGKYTILNLLQHSIGVCHRWNSLIMSSKSLWTNIHLDDFAWNIAQTESSHAEVLLRTCFERAGHHLLSIQISIIHSLSIGLRTILRMHSKQLHSLQLTTNAVDRQALEEAFPPKADYMMLERLSLNMFFSQLNRVESTPLSFLNAPRLHNIRLAGLRTAVVRLSIPLSQILIMSLQRTSIDDALQLAALCPLLRDLDIERDSEEDAKNIEMPARITLPSLKRLRFLTGSACDCELPPSQLGPLDLLFSAISCPSLTDLTLQGDLVIHEDDCDRSDNHHLQRKRPNIAGFLSKCQELRTLYVLGLEDVAEEDLIAMLVATPSLTSFTYQQSKDFKDITKLSNKIFTRMTAHGNDPDYRNSANFRPLLPRLTHLDLTFSSTTAIANDVIPRMIKSRWQPASLDVTEIRFLRLNSTDRTEGLKLCSLVQDELENLRMAGLACHID